MSPSPHVAEPPRPQQPTPAAPPGSRTQPQPVHVVHLIHTMAYGGVETALLNWTRATDPDRFRVHLVCFENPGGGGTEQPFVDAVHRHGMTIEKIPWGRRKPLLKAARALAAILRRHDARILHTHNWYADFVGVIAARLAPVKTVTTAYVWSDYDLKRNALQALDKYVIRWFDQITAHCDDTYRKTVALGIPAHRVKTLICGFESQAVHMPHDERLRRRREAGIGDDQTLLVNVARLYPEKAQDALLRMFKEVVRQRPNARLWIAGVGPLEQGLKSLCTGMGLDPHVRFVGFTNKLPEFLCLPDVQVHPAHIEGVPLAILAGMDAALPIVASSVGGLPEVLHDGATGLLVAPGDEDAFVRQTVRLIDDADLRRRLGSAARHFVQNDYSLRAAVDRVHRVYNEVLGTCA